MLADERDERLEHLDLVELRLRQPESQLGKDLAERGDRGRVEVEPASASRSAAASGT